MAYTKTKRSKRPAPEGKLPKHEASRKHRREGTGGLVGYRRSIAAYYNHFRNGHSSHFG